MPNEPEDPFKGIPDNVRLVVGTAAATLALTLLVLAAAGLLR